MVETGMGGDVQKRYSNVELRTVVITLAFAVSLAFGLATANVAEAATPGQSDTAPPVGSADRFVGSADYKAAHNSLKQQPLNATDAALIRAKDAASLAHVKLKAAQRASGSVSPSALAVTATLPVTRQIQQTAYWCGPASVSEVLTYKGKRYTQSTAANQLRTTTDGTNWYGSNNHPSPDPKWNTNYPVRDVLNYNLNTTFYVPRDWVNKTTASESDKSLFKTNLASDIDDKYPLVGDAWESPTGPHLAGHPVGQELFHWFVVRGYANSGNIAAYVDSATFGGAVPGYSNYDAGTIAVILAGRGYIW
jgi:hypothetical protein